jgi:hypothetical protein
MELVELMGIAYVKMDGLGQIVQVNLQIANFHFHLCVFILTEL